MTELSGKVEELLSQAREIAEARGHVVVGTEHLLLAMQRDGLCVSLEALRAAARDHPARQRELPDSTTEQRRVLRNFVDGSRLTHLPARRGRRRVILEDVAGRFDTDRHVEAEVNELLNSLHDDHAALRRYLVVDRTVALRVP